MTYSVYAVSLRGDLEYRYIGETSQPIECRLANHLTRGAHDEFGRWTRENAASLTVASLGRYEHRHEALASEKLAIKASLERGHRLFNSNHVPGRRVRTSFRKQPA